MFRLFFLLVSIVVVWLVVNAIVKGIIRTFGGYRPQQQSPFGPRTPSARQTQQKFDDIKDADYTDITDGKA